MASATQNIHVVVDAHCPSTYRWRPLPSMTEYGVQCKFWAGHDLSHCGPVPNGNDVFWDTPSDGPVVYDSLCLRTK